MDIFATVSGFFTMFDSGHLFAFLRSLEPGWMYTFIFIMVFIETSFFAGLLVPGTFMFVFAGVLSSLGIISTPLALAIIWVGSYLGDMSGYALGWYFHAPAQRFVKRLFPFVPLDAYIRQAQRFLEKHGPWALVLSHFIGPLRSALPFSVGVLRYPVRKMALFSLLGALLLGSVLFGIGYFLGEAWEARGSTYLQYIYFGMVGLALALYWYFGHREDK